MVAHATTLLGSLSVYGLVCCISVLAGLGCLALLRLRLKLRTAVLLAPVVTLALWAIVLGGGVSLYVPVKYLAPSLWVVTIGLASFGAVRSGSALLDIVASLVAPDRPPNQTRARFASPRRLFSILFPIGFVLLLPVVTFFPNFRHGFPDFAGSTFPDGWSYSAFGDYLWHHARGTNGGLSPLHQFGALLSHTRFVSASLLGFLSPRDPQGALALFFPLVLFVFGSACAFLARTLRLRFRIFLPFLVLAVDSGWIRDAAWVNNLDNALFLPYLPALAGLIARFRPKDLPWTLAIALLLGGLLYTYPEMVVFAFLILFLVAVDRILRDRSDRRSIAISGSKAFGLAVLLAIPSLPDYYRFLMNQLASTRAAAGRPGEGMFAGLLSLRHGPTALWALGGEFRTAPWFLPRTAIALLLGIAAAVGLYRLARSGRIGLAGATIACLLVAAFLIRRQAYSYGAYKLILLAWWGLALAVALGTDRVVRNFPRVLRGRRAALACAAPALLVLPFNGAGTVLPGAIPSKFESLSASDFRAAAKVVPIAHGAGVLAVVDDWLTNEWAVYYLRDASLIVDPYRLYMAQPHVIPSMDRARVIAPELVRYVLTDNNPPPASDWSLAWAGGPYRLWKPATADWALVTEIHNPNGLEHVENEPFFWIGSGETRIDLFASHSGTLRLSGTFLPGPSLPERSERRVLLTTTRGVRQEVTLTGSPGEAFHVSAPGGKSSVILRSLDAPSPRPLENGDTRPLLLGVKHLTTALEPSPVSVEEIVNENGLEQVGGEPFFWMGKGTTKVMIQSSRAGHLILEAGFTPGPSLPGVALRRVHVTTDHGHDSIVKILAGRQSLQVPIPQGRTVVSLTPLDLPTVRTLPNGDSRPLLLGVHGLSPFLETN